jgi:Abnormal spindle-like microcephaly-assoc'd, ASPM-SPD-2-Hydin/Immunoglobulin I-set domain/Immunoglobulin domain
MRITGRIRNNVENVAAVVTILFVFGTVAQARVRSETIRPIAGLSFSGAPGSSLATQSFGVSDTSPINATFTAATDQSWLSISSASPTTVPGNSVVVAVNTAGLAAGTYTGHAIITIPDQSGYRWTNSPYFVPVTLTIATSAPKTTSGTPETIRPIAGLSFSSVAVSSTSASILAPQSFSVSDSSPINATFTAATDQPWLSIASASPTTVPGNSVVVAVKTAGLAAGTYTGHAIISIPDQSGYAWTNSPYSVPVTLTIASSTATAPTITTQPASVKIAAGQTATFNVAATGTSPMTYQWRKNGTAMSGATFSTYTTSSETTADNNAQFTVVVGNSAGNATSNAAVLTVTSSTVAPTISTQPASQTVIAGKTATFSVAAAGTSPLTYQWSKNGAAISGATSASYTTPAETSADNNAQFTVVVSNSAGNATSNAASLTVTAASLVLNASSSSLSFGNVNVSSSASQSVTLTNAGNSSVTISNVTVSGAGFNANGVSSGIILNPGQTSTLTATFAPAAAGSVTGSVSVASNASNSPDAVSLSGTGVAVVNHSVDLSWTPSTSNVMGYNTYSSKTSGGPYTKLNASPVSTTLYTDSTVQAGQTYYYVVTAVDSSNVESVYSTEVNALVP